MSFNSSYHTEKDLKEIQNWNLQDVYNLLERLRELWEYPKYFIKNWRIDNTNKKKPILILELHTGGWSGNEDIIDALENNKLFWLMYWWKIEKGGHYYFEIDFSLVGYKPVSLFIKENKLSRQYVSKNKDKYEWIKISYGRRLIRLKQNNEVKNLKSKK